MALALGSTVEDLQERMSSIEFTGWLCYYKIAPFGDDRADLRSAIVASTIANTAPRRKGAKAFKPQDFMPQFGASHSKQQSVEDMQRRIMQAAEIAKQQKQHEQQTE